MKYLELLNKSEETMEKESLEFLNENANISLQKDILTVKQQLYSAKNNLQSCKGYSKFSSETIFINNNEVQLLERKLKFLTDLQKELF